MQIIVQKDHAHSPTIQWNPVKLQVTLRNADKAITYVLLTNSVKLNTIDQAHLQQICQDCQKQINSVTFSIKIGDMPPQQLDAQLKDFKYCILPFAGQACRLEDSLGHRSIINAKQHSIITNNLVISSEKTIRSSEQIDRALFYTNSSSKGSESVEQGSCEDLSTSVVFSLRKEQEIIEHYQLFVTKLQREVGQGYRSYMFYEYAWTEVEMEYIMAKIQKYFGSIHSFRPKRRYLCFTFARNKYDYLFRNKFQDIGKQLLFRQNIKLQGNILNYYLISKEQLLPREQQTGKLFLLPNNEPITDMLILNNWIIVAAGSYIMFVHSERPMEYFHHQQKIYPTQVTSHMNDSKLLFAADKRGIIYVFQVLQTKIVVKTKYNISFVSPYAIVHLQCGIAVAGIDNQQSKKISRRSIFIVKIDGKIDKSFKPLPIEMRLQVVTIQGENKNPINNITSTKQKDVVACTWNQTFFLISLQGFKLIEVELKSSINKLIPVPFMFNLLNFIMLLRNGDIVRVGIECYGQGLGAEVSQLNAAHASDCILVNHQGSKFELYGCEGNKIDRLNYLKDQKHHFLYENIGKIIKLATNKEGMAYLLDLDHSIQLKYLEI